MGWLGDWGGGLLGAALGYKGQRDANKQNIALSREQMQFQERMSSTAYQRAARDLDAAGLNRILALGAPSSTPGGAMARVESEEGAGLSSALEARRLTEDLKLLRAQAEQVQEAAKTQRTQQELNTAAAYKAGVEADVARTRGELMNYTIPREKTRGDVWKGIRKVGSTYGSGALKSLHEFGSFLGISAYNTLESLRTTAKEYEEKPFKIRIKEGAENSPYYRKKDRR